MISNEELGKRLKHFRQSRKITQQEMAKYCHVSKNHLSALERGVYTCSVPILLAYAEKLNISLDELIGTHEKEQTILPELKMTLLEMSTAQQQQILDIIRITKRSI